MIALLERIVRTLKRRHQDRCTRAALERLDPAARRDFAALVRCHKDAVEVSEFKSKRRSAGARRRSHIAAMTPTIHP